MKVNFLEEPTKIFSPRMGRKHTQMKEVMDEKSGFDCEKCFKGGCLSCGWKEEE